MLFTLLLNGKYLEPQSSLLDVPSKCWSQNTVDVFGSAFAMLTSWTSAFVIASLMHEKKATSRMMTILVVIACNNNTAKIRDDLL